MCSFAENPDGDQAELDEIRKLDIEETLAAEAEEESQTGYIYEDEEPDPVDEDLTWL